MRRSASSACFAHALAHGTERDRFWRRWKTAPEKDAFDIAHVHEVCSDFLREVEGLVDNLRPRWKKISTVCT